ncbi:secretogranin-1 isoform X2 [Thalassophryne amazonica]|uniref:secretogranin-1 isoform X2 n=2 Tax=Thalassophryne amazonica TaxID=390379 RepID=UPI001470D86C|nr:secretogranin-1 isoform X2 [Thalassophryne amazonica]
MFTKMSLILVVAIAALLAENLALPLEKGVQREDVVSRCLVEVLSKALSKPDTQSLDQECKDILQAGLNHSPLDKKTREGTLTHEEVVKAEQPEAKGADMKDIEALLKSVEEKRENSEDERSQESWSVGDEKDKRQESEEQVEREKRNWRPGRFHQKNHKRGADDEDGERSQESWGVEEKRADQDDEEREKRYWRPGRYHQKLHKRDEELSEEPREEPEEERSQESWGLENDREKRYWRPGRHHQRRHKRDEELSEEPKEESVEDRSQESWGLENEREKREWRPGRYHQRRHKRDEELSEEERSQEYWDFDKRDANEEEIEKHIWKPTHRYHHKKNYHKRGGDSSEEDAQQRSDSEESEEDGRERDEALRYLAEKRNPWIFRGYYHPAWYKGTRTNTKQAQPKRKNWKTSRQWMRSCKKLQKSCMRTVNKPETMFLKSLLFCCSQFCVLTVLKIKCTKK